MYPIYARGLAYLAAHQPAEADHEFQRILHHRSTVLVDPMDAMARLRLARWFALAGEPGQTRRAYDDIFTVWKTADVGVPAIEQGKAEYARLP